MKQTPRQRKALRSSAAKKGWQTRRAEERLKQAENAWYKFLRKLAGR